MSSLLSVHNLVTEYTVRGRRIRAVDDVSFELKRGKTLGIAGESGCGKTTLALSIAQLLPQNAAITSGKMLFDGRNITESTEDELRKEIRWKRISIVFQGSMSALDPVIKVGDQLVEAIRLHDTSVTRSIAWEHCKRLLSSIGVPESRIDSYPHQLSGGMRQRVMIAMALACSPDLVIADEPTTALDVLVQAQIIQLLKKLRDDFGKSLIFISHDLSVVAQVADECAIMYAGKIVEIGTVRQIFGNPLHPYTMKLLSAFPDVKEDSKARLLGIPGEPPSLMDPPVGCRFNPRCEHAMDICRRQEPQLIEYESGHFTSCFWREQKW